MSLHRRRLMMTAAVPTARASAEESSASVPHRVHVRFGWSNIVQNSLYNGDGLPPSTFISEPLLPR